VIGDRVADLRASGSEAWEVVIVGGGPAGLSAGLILGRCRRRTLICDSGEYRNEATRAVHGFLTRDGTPPGEMLRLARRDLERYPSVVLRGTEIVEAAHAADGFRLRARSGETYACRKLLLATGIVDVLPDLPGIDTLYGHTVFHCPYCDGWEWRDRAIAVYARGERALHLVSALWTWSRDLVLCSDGPLELEKAERATVEGLVRALREDPVRELAGTDGRLSHIVLRSGEILPCEALFFALGQRQRSSLAASLGCPITTDHHVPTGDKESTPIPGLFVAGDASRSVQLAIVAAAEGAEAAFAINKELQQQEQRPSGRDAR